MNKLTLFIAVLFASFQSFAQDLDPTGGGLCTGLSYEVINVDPLGTGAATYRLYANLTADASEVTAMYGTDSTPWEMIATSPDGFYNDAVGADFGGAINPLFFAAFPNMEFDSWFTIGAAPGDADGMNSAFDADLTSLADFNSGGDFVVNTFIGGSVFVVPGSNAQGVPVGGKVLLGQFTSAGQVHALVNIQIRDQALESHYAEGVALTFPQVEMGCMDMTACNYNPAAELDDGSCAVNDDCGVCGGDNSSCSGCTDTTSCNYDSFATIDDGSCLVNDVCGICGGDGTTCEGCTDSLACNYDSSAVTDDDSCLFNDDCGVCGGDNSTCGGCTDSTSCNYDPTAIIDDGSCGLSDVCGICGGDGSSCSGCMNPEADNYDASASFDDGSCAWGDGLCTGLSYEIVSADPLGTGATTYRLFANFTADASEVTAMYGTDTTPWEMIATDEAGFYNDAVGADFGGSINPLFFASFPSLEFDSWFTIGATPGDENGMNSAFDADLTSIADFNSGGDFIVNTFIGGSVFVVPGANAQGVPVDGKVLLGQFTTVGQIQALVNIQVRDQSQESHLAEGMTLVFPEGIAGCQDMTACNYNSEAVYEDESCEYPETYYTCEGCINDTDGDGVCDELEIVGCTDSSACNYDPEATDSADICTYPDTGYDCEGVCLADSDGDGVCDEFEIVGCTDNTACNYDANATDAGNCTYPAVGYDCAGVCLNDADGDGVCDQFEIAGCTNPNADNYNSDATDDDGSCIVVGCTYVGADNYDVANTIESGSCVFSGCTDPAAENFIAFANNDDGSCITEPCTGGSCPFDTNGDGEIGSADLLDFLIAYGATCDELVQ